MKEIIESEVRALTPYERELSEEIERLNDEIGSLKALLCGEIERQHLVNEQVHNSVRKDLIRDLSAEYKDALEVCDEPMDEELGEIFRQKFFNVFKILKRNGIVM